MSFSLEEESRNTIGLKNLAIIFIYSLVLGLLFNEFFYRNPIGTSFPVYTLMITFGYFMLTIFRKQKTTLQTYILIIAALLTSSMVFVRSSSLLTFINIVATISILILVVSSSVGLKISKFRIRDYILSHMAPIEFIVAFGDSLVDFRLQLTQSKDKKMFLQILRGLAITLPILIILLILFSSADLIFDKYLKEIIDLDITFDTFVQGFIIIYATLAFIGAYYYILTKKTDHYDSPIKTSQRTGNLGIVEISILLGSINFLFLLFIIIQITYLFGGESNVSIQGFTYSQYARKGFFELIAVALISFLILWKSHDEAANGEKSKEVIFKILSGVLIMLVLIIMTSAYKRLLLYEEAYGFTTLRLYSHIFTVWLGSVFIYLLYKILKDGKESLFMLKVAITSYAFLAFINILNPDAFIAKSNISRYKTTGKIDLAYLSHLSDDSIPELLPLANAKNNKIKRQMAGELHRWYNSIFEFKKDNPWYSSTLSRNNAGRLLDEQKKVLEKYKKYRVADDQITD